jgi:general secretion pathway protein A
MYHDFFALRERPFKLVPDPAYLFLSKVHEEALAHLTYALAHGDGFTAITGEVGTGKTTLCRAFLDNIDAETVAAYIFNPKLDAVQLLQTINDEFDIDSTPVTCKELIDILNSFLLETRMTGRKAILVIDEAQNLSSDVLEQLRLLSNLETNTEKLLQIILVGQPELASMLSSYQLRQLGQRITINYRLTPFQFGDTRQYIEHRIQVASPGKAVRFSIAAIYAIHRFSMGIPRLINIACDRALLIAFTRNRHSVSWSIVKKAIKELSIKQKETNKDTPLTRIFAALLVVIVFLWSLLFFLPYLNKEKIPVLAFINDQQGIPVKVEQTEPSRQSEPAVQNPAPSPAFIDFAEIPSGELLSRKGALEKIFLLWQQEESVLTDQFEALTDPLFFLLACRSQNYILLTIKDNLEMIDLLNLPTVFKITLPGRILPSYLPLVHIRDDQYTFQLKKQKTVIPAGLLKQYWTGEAYIPWKNFRAIEGVIPGKTKADSILALKMLLQETGFTDLAMTPVYDSKTRKAVLDIQQQAGITADGVVGPATKISIYNGLKTFQIPHLR